MTVISVVALFTTDGGCTFNWGARRTTKCQNRCLPKWYEMYVALKRSFTLLWCRCSLCLTKQKWLYTDVGEKLAVLGCPADLHDAGRDDLDLVVPAAAVWDLERTSDTLEWWSITPGLNTTTTMLHITHWPWKAVENTRYKVFTVFTAKHPISGTK